MEHGLVPEDFGGETICVDVSATKRTGLDKLLEMIQLQAEVLELRADPERRASGVVLEAQLDKGRGPVATVLVQQGTLRPGDTLVAGVAMGRVRAMEDERGRRLDEAGPSVPVQVTGLDRVPDAGEQVHVVESERVAKDIVSHREGQRREGGAEAAAPKRSLEEIFAAAEGGGVKELQVVLKADTRGSVEALRDALLKLSRDEVKVDVLLAGVGAVTESDVMLAKASGAWWSRSTCGPSRRRAARPKARASSCAPTRSSTRWSTTSARRWRACCRRRSARPSAAAPRCGRPSACRASARSPAATSPRAASAAAACAG